VPPFRATKPVPAVAWTNALLYTVPADVMSTVVNPVSSSRCGVEYAESTGSVMVATVEMPNKLELVVEPSSSAYAGWPADCAAAFSVLAYADHALLMARMGLPNTVVS
jgi:hypothetical protein